MNHGRARTLALIRHLGAIAPRRGARVRRMPRQAQPDAIRLAYFNAMAPICDRARAEVDRVQPEIIAGLRQLRATQGQMDSLPWLGTPDSYPALLEALRRQFAGAGVVLRTIGQTTVGPIMVADVPGPRAIVVVAGQLGTDPAGPLLFARHAAALCARARAAGVGLRIYPCADPEAFHARLARDRRAVAFAEYSAGGQWVGELQPGQQPDDQRRPAGQTPAAAALQNDLEPWVAAHQPAALLDLRQDGQLRTGFVYGYAHAGTRAVWARLLARAGLPMVNAPLRSASWTSARLATGPDGLLVYRDGSVGAWAAAAGVPYSAAIAATADDDQDAVDVHRSVLSGLIAAAGRTRQDASGSSAAAAIDRAAERFRQAFHPNALHEVVKEFGKATSRHQRLQLDQQLRDAVGVPFAALEQPVHDAIPDWTRENVVLIKTVPERYFERLRLEVEDAYASGTHPETLAHEFADRYEISLNDARRIARDQIGKLNAQVNEQRQVALGVETFTWRTMNDNRVCDECAAKAGQVFAWNDAALECKPGECHPMDRCYGDPDLTAVINGPAPAAGGEPDFSWGEVGPQAPWGAEDAKLGRRWRVRPR